ncbi:hypothetical protein B0T16DRAFT_390322 [Cercophora newfieldiana]|uniref:Uncharacterized protein n=1 Tax=Cercophora newfieldiana TaxID=92897 RepID=A0AA40CQR3_9PEZI|nr:hypothetical protein B0T16DRAFT_390322 [Cercophora newfieldiana]
MAARPSQEDFAEQISLLSQQSSKETLYPRPDFTALRRYVKAPAPGPRITSDGSSAASFTSLSHDETITNAFAVIHDLQSGTPVYFPSASLTEFSDYKPPGAARGSLVFMRGYARPEWLGAIGEKYKVDLELYQRHLQNKPFAAGGRDCYSTPCLPSASTRVFQLTIPTIWERGTDFNPCEPEDLERDRQHMAKSLVEYNRQMRNGVAGGAESMVSNCLQFSKKTYVLEQTVTVEVGPPSTGGSWRAIIWMDSGKDLSRGVHGPWSPPPGSRAWETYFVPVVVQGPSATRIVSSDTLRPGNLRPEPSPATLRPQLSRHSTLRPQAATSPPWQLNHHHQGQGSSTPVAHHTPAEEWRANQNVCLLPLRYGSCLDKNVAGNDALYAISELLRFAAAAEAQFFSLVDERIQQELSFVGRSNAGGRQYAISLLNLNYIKTSLRLHAASIAGTVELLGGRGMLNWPRVSAPTSDFQVAERMAALLDADFAYLLRQAEALAHQCDRGIDTLANSSALEQSRRSADNAMRVEKLTMLASIFIPLSFVCSIWGMNFREMGSGQMSIWMWFATAGPVIIFSFIIYRMELIKKWVAKARDNNEE